MDIILALDEYVSDNGPYSGSVPRLLVNHINLRFAGPDIKGQVINGGDPKKAAPKKAAPKKVAPKNPGFWAEGLDDAVKKRYKELLKNIIIVQNVTGGPGSLWSRVQERPSYGLICGGWHEHAVGILYTRIDQKTTNVMYELSVLNTGEGGDWHGTCVQRQSDPISEFHPETAGLLICKPISEGDFQELCRRMMLLKKSSVQSREVWPALFYRVVFSNVLSKDRVDGQAWTAPWLNADRVAYYMQLPSQTTGDCVFRSLFFTMLADRTICNRPEAVVKPAVVKPPVVKPAVVKPGAKNSPPVKLTAPQWFWDWYGQLVAMSLGRIVDKAESWRFTQSELVSMRDRALSLSLYLHEFAAKAADLVNAKTALLNVSERCNAAIRAWYDSTVLRSTVLLTGVQRLSIADADRVMRMRANPPTSHVMLTLDNKITVHKAPNFEYNLTAALNTYDKVGRGSTWAADMTIIRDTLAEKKLSMRRSFVDRKAMLSRVEVVALVHAFHRMLDKHPKPTVQYADITLHAVYEILTSNTVLDRYYDMVLLYGMCYIALRKCLSKSYDALINTFGPELDARCFDGPVHSRKHADMITFVIDSVKELKVLVSPQASEKPLSELYMAATSKTPPTMLGELVTLLGAEAFGHTKWMDNMVYLHFYTYLNDANGVYSKQCTVPMLILLSSMFNNGAYNEYCMPVFISDLSTMDYVQRTTQDDLECENFTRSTVDFVNPFKLSLDVLFDPISMEQGNASSTSALRTPADFYLNYGAMTTEASKTSVNIFLDPTERSSAEAEAAARYIQTRVTAPIPTHLPSAEVAYAVIDRWVARLVDGADPFTMACNTEEWNMAAYALLYLDGMYTVGEQRTALYTSLRNSPRCGAVLKMLLSLLTDESSVDAAEETWTCVLNGGFDRQVTKHPIGIYNVTQTYNDVGMSQFANFTNMYSQRGFKLLNYFQHTRHMYGATLAFLKGTAGSDKYAKPDDIYYEWVLSHVCHELVARRACPANDSMQRRSQADLEGVAYGGFMDCRGQAISFTQESPNVFTASFCCYQHRGVRLSYSIPLSPDGTGTGSHDVVAASFIPTRPQTFRFTIESSLHDPTYTLKVLEPLPPHPLFQKNFKWSENVARGKWYGEPASTSILKANNYCLLYDPNGGGVEQTRPKRSSARCDFDTLDNAKLVFVPMPALLGSGPYLLRALCARLLSFCYSDLVLVWRTTASTSPEYRIEMLSHGTTLRYGAAGIMFGGMRLLDEAPSPAWAFWTYQMPSAFLAEENGKHYLLVFSMHRHDQGVLDGCSCVKGGLFGDNDIEAVQRRDNNIWTDHDYHYMMQQRPASAHAINIHPSGAFLMPSSAEALHSLQAAAHTCGRTDVVAEIQRLVKLTAAVYGTTDSHTLHDVNFARSKRAPTAATSRLRQPVWLQPRGHTSATSLVEEALVGESRILVFKGNFTGKGAANQVLVHEPMLPAVPAPDYTGRLPPSLDVPKRPVLIERGIDRRRHVNILYDLTALIVDHHNAQAGSPTSSLGLAQFAFLKQLKPRPDQLDFAAKVSSDYDSGGTPHVHNLLMGGGKTSVVTPLVILNSVHGLTGQETSDIVIVTPQKLLQQTTRLLMALSAYMDVPMHVVSGQLPHFWEAPRLGAGRCLYVASDRAMKESLLKRRSHAPTEIRYLLDEADMMMNPYTSELNIPQETTSFCAVLAKKHGDVGPGCLSPIIDSIFAELAGEPAGDVPNRLREHLKLVLQQVRNRVHRLHYGHAGVPEEVSRTVDLLEAGESVTEGAMAALRAYHEGDILAIPYAFAETPSVGSEFSDPLLAVAFTVASLHASRLDRVRMFFFLTRMCKASASDALPPDLLKRYAPGFTSASNRWEWIKTQLGPLQADDGLLRAYAKHYVPQKLSVFRTTLSACGLDLVMAGFHPRRSGFTGTPETGFAIRDSGRALVIKGKVQASVDLETSALAKLAFAVAEDVKAHIVKGAVLEGGYSVIIDVGSQFLGVSPTDLMCDLMRAHPGVPLELVFWNERDEPTVMDRTGAVVEWNGHHEPHQVVFYDHAHTTGTDATLRDGVKACITMRGNTRYRDFVQGLFRLRKIVADPGTSCTVVATSGLLKDLNSQGLLTVLNRNEEQYVISQHPVRAQQNALALLRSTSSLTDNMQRLVETSVDYLRDRPFHEYLRARMHAAPAPTTKLLVELAEQFPTTQVLQMEGQVENTSQQEAEAEAEHEVDRLRLVKDSIKSHVPMDFAALLSKKHMEGLCTKRGGYWVSNAFAIYNSVQPTLDQLFRPMIVTVNDGAKRVVLMADAILLKDFLQQHGNQLSETLSVTVSDREGNVWFTHGTATKGGSSKSTRGRATSGSASSTRSRSSS